MNCLKHPLIFGVLISSATLSGLACAQTTNSSSQQSLNLKWEPMTLVGFHAGRIPLPPVSRADTDLARNTWAKEINSTPVSRTDDGGRLPSFILLKTFMAGNSQLTFSIFSAAMAKDCTPPGNGRGIEDMYSLCPLRVAQYANGKHYTQEFKNYCHLFPENDSDGAINQSQMAFDANSMTAYFRTIQHGKHVRECDRKLKIN